MDTSIHPDRFQDLIPTDPPEIWGLGKQGVFIIFTVSTSWNAEKGNVRLLFSQNNLPEHIDYRSKGLEYKPGSRGGHKQPTNYISLLLLILIELKTTKEIRDQQELYLWGSMWELVLITQYHHTM